MARILTNTTRPVQAQDAWSVGMHYQAPFYAGTAVYATYGTIDYPALHHFRQSELTPEEEKRIEEAAATDARIRALNDRKRKLAEGRGRERGQSDAERDIEVLLSDYKARVLARLDAGDGLPLDPDVEIRYEDVER